MSAGMELPGKHCEDTLQSAEFWANKVLLESRTPASLEWVRALKELLRGLAAYCRRCHPAGPAWNAAGVPLAQFRPGAAAAPPAAAGALLPPPRLS